MLQVNPQGKTGPDEPRLLPPGNSPSGAWCLVLVFIWEEGRELAVWKLH